MFTKNFWLATLERAVKTFGQTAAGYLTLDAIQAGDPINLDNLLFMGLAGALLSVLTSLASVKSGTAGPGLGSAETTEEEMPELSGSVLYDDEPVDEVVDEDEDEDLEEPEYV